MGHLKENRLIKNAFIFLVQIATYMIIAIPFKVMEIIPGFTDIRPVMLLQPIFGVFFGIPGCLASAVSNLICDAISDSLMWSSIGGFVANFIGPFCFHIFYTRFFKDGFNLRSGKNILIFCAVTLFGAILQAAIITPMVAVIYSEVNVGLFILSVMLNNTAFPILIGIPIIILMQEELGFKPKPKIMRKTLANETNSLYNKTEHK